MFCRHIGDCRHVSAWSSIRVVDPATSRGWRRRGGPIRPRRYGEPRRRKRLRMNPASLPDSANRHQPLIIHGAGVPAAWRCWRRYASPHRGAISIRERTARTEPSFGLRPLRSSSKPDRCTGFLFAVPRFCTRQQKVPLQHQASLYHEGHP
jgi:hypothetical protein